MADLGCTDILIFHDDEMKPKKKSTRILEELEEHMTSEGMEKEFQKHMKMKSSSSVDDARFRGNEKMRELADDMPFCDNMTNINGDSPLHVAARAKNLVAVRKILDLDKHFKTSEEEAEPMDKVELIINLNISKVVWPLIGLRSIIMVVNRQCAKVISLIGLDQLWVSVELGLCEMMSREAISPALAPKDGNWGFDIAEREAILPAGTVDKNAKRMYKELPKWEEPVLGTRARYEQVINDLADNYHTENLLLVTHGEGIGVALAALLKNAIVYEVDYCAYVELKRPIFKEDQSFTAGEFEVLTRSGQTGIGFIHPSA
ncbi:uncharacterized protein LOC114751548 [Neltuma alba]|uniref:uncharacterized protein LOC114751548 n=1 Tax=Neltuma alba TaxID=207710 RepID=UPI0010A400EF|nr:uncharacterized protein LOC114751548 [Prosopis alba]